MQKKQKIYLLVFAAIALVLFWAFISAGLITHNFNRGVLKKKSGCHSTGILVY